MMKRQDVVDAARKYLGVKWKHQGRMPESGLDCLGFIVQVAKDLGMEPHDPVDYTRMPDGQRLMQELNVQLKPVLTYDTGDVLLMRMGTNPQHLAIVTETGGIIHSYANIRRVVEHPLDDEWKSRIVCAYSVPGIE